MKTLLTAASVLALTGAASADVLLIVDLTVPNQVTINATNGLSAISAASSAFNGVLLADFYNGPSTLGVAGGTGNLTSTDVASDGTPSLFSGATDPGLNLWSYSASSSNFVAGQQAFSGSGTWILTPTLYAEMLAGNSSGNIYANIDSSANIPGNGIIGTWALIPTPGTAGLLGLAGLAAVRRRR